GQLIEMEDWQAENPDQKNRTEFDYALPGLLKQVKQPDGSILSYEYDGIGRKTGLVYPNGQKVSYAYNTQSLLQSVLGLSGEETQARFALDLLYFTHTWCYNPMENMFGRLQQNEQHT
ncbi:MAG: hypothetical protein FWD25_13045, partial [Clostridia bacterium]|nr:hypothetical protein [Clostridia bacterium]